MDRSKFSFFKSYYESFKDLPPEVVGIVVKAMGSYFFDGVEPKLDGLAGAVFSLIKPVLDSSKKKAENGAKGGAPEGNSNASKQAKNKQKTSKIQPKNNLETSKKQANDKQKQAIRNRNKDIGIEDIEEDKDIYKDININKNININKDIDTDKKEKNIKKEKPVYFPNDELLNTAFERFIAHRKFIKRPMGEDAIELNIKKLNKLSGGDSEKAIEIINQSIERGWQGLFELKETNKQTIADKWRDA